MTFRTEHFSHIYVEEEIRNKPMTSQILDHFPRAEIILIRQYHDVFSRSKQDYSVQKHSRNLILARQHGTLLYEGAPVCHSFGHEHFYYTSPALNCLADCEYCWLKGMYSTANTVIFINDPDEYLNAAVQISERFNEAPVFVSFSYETDLFPLEPLTGFLKHLSLVLPFGETVTAEIRTKCASPEIIRSLSRCDNLVLAFTVSPQEMIDRYEHGTSPLAQRLNAVNTALECGFPVRLCFDPMILFPGWRDAYAGMLEKIRETVDLSAVTDFSIGSYRQSDQYQKRMRSRFPDSAVIQYPYEVHNGYCMYPDRLRDELENGFRDMLAQYVDPKRIFLLKEEQ